LTLENKLKRFSITEAQAFDWYARQKLGLCSLILMENAGRSVAEEALKMLRGKKRVTIVCGVGNNGGDGLVAARHLINAGKKVQIILIGNVSKLKPDPKTNYNILKKMKVKIVKTLKELKEIGNGDLVVDAILGIGLRSEVRGHVSKVIRVLNQSNKPILAVDVPSGLDADTGNVLGVAIKAKKTITFVAAKKGFSKADGPKHCGKIIIRPIF